MAVVIKFDFGQGTNSFKAKSKNGSSAGRRSIPGGKQVATVEGLQSLFNFLQPVYLHLLHGSADATVTRTPLINFVLLRYKFYSLIRVVS